MEKIESSEVYEIVKDIYTVFENNLALEIVEDLVRGVDENERIVILSNEVNGPVIHHGYLCGYLRRCLTDKDLHRFQILIQIVFPRAELDDLSDFYEDFATCWLLRACDALEKNDMESYWNYVDRSDELFQEYLDRFGRRL